MREIKFRLFSKKTNRMLQWEDFPNWYGLKTLSDNEENEKYSPWMQYTGLMDKNQKDVYEGDIVKIHSDDPDEIYEVRFDCGGFMAGDMFLDDYWNSFGYMFEVVGNVFEDGDLLSDSEGTETD